jgi:ribosomal protein S18 acetylase RimI-like enzyme
MAAGIEQAADLLQTMRLAFEEYRNSLNPPTGALIETIDDVRAALANGGAFLARVDDTVVGSARYRFRNGYIYTERVAVNPEYRRKGVGSALMQAIEKTAQESGYPQLRLSVRASLASNLKFYEDLGYRALESRRHPRGPDFEITLSKTITRQR